MRLIESDNFPFEFVSRLAERESWRKEVHRPIYHLHKWWATRLGSVFRSVLLASVLPDWRDTGVLAVYGLAAFFLGGLVFRHLKRGFADVL